MPLCGQCFAKRSGAVVGAARYVWLSCPQSYDYFSSSVPFFQIPDSLGDLTQPVTPVDDRRYLSGRHEIAHDGQVLFVQFRDKHDEVLAHEP